jgi:Bacterial Ig domain
MIFNPTSGIFALSASPAQLSVMQGASGTSVITTTATGGFNGAITLSAAGTPPSGNASFSPTSIPAPGAGSSTLSLATDASTPAGSYTLTLSGTGGGVTQTITVSVTVTSATSPPSIAVTAPADGSTVSGLTTVSAAPSGTGATKLEIYIDGALKACNFGAASISYPWDTTGATNGSHTVMAKGYNSAGAAASSTTINVMVAN